MARIPILIQIIIIKYIFEKIITLTLSVTPKTYFFYLIQPSDKKKSSDFWKVVVPVSTLVPGRISKTEFGKTEIKNNFFLYFDESTIKIPGLE